MFAIVVTANHFWLDAVGGVIALGVGLKVALARPGSCRVQGTFRVMLLDALSGPDDLRGRSSRSLTISPTRFAS